jgi:hypothetical protein
LKFSVVFFPIKSIAAKIAADVDGAKAEDYVAAESSKPRSAEEARAVARTDTGMSPRPPRKMIGI